MSEMMSYRRGFTLPDDLPCYFQKSSIVCISLRSQYFQFQSLFVMLVFFFLFWLCYLTLASIFSFKTCLWSMFFTSYFDCVSWHFFFSFKACLWSLFFFFLLFWLFVLLDISKYFQFQSLFVKHVFCFLFCVTWHKPVFSVSKLCFQV